MFGFCFTDHLHVVLRETSIHKTQMNNQTD